MRLPFINQKFIRGNFLRESSERKAITRDKLFFQKKSEETSLDQAPLDLIVLG